MANAFERSGDGGEPFPHKGVGGEMFFEFVGKVNFFEYRARFHIRSLQWRGEAGKHAKRVIAEQVKDERFSEGDNGGSTRQSRGSLY